MLGLWPKRDTYKHIFVQTADEVVKAVNLEISENIRENAITPLFTHRACIACDLRAQGHVIRSVPCTLQARPCEEGTERVCRTTAKTCKLHPQTVSYLSYADQLADVQAINDTRYSFDSALSHVVAALCLFLSKLVRSMTQLLWLLRELATYLPHVARAVMLCSFH